MTNSTLHLVSSKREQNYESVVWRDAESVAGVRYAISRLSFGRRIELARRIHEIARKAEFLGAGADAREKLESAVINAQADEAYLDTCLIALEGLTIDGDRATPATQIAQGPLGLTTEILAAIKAECSLKEDERKN